MENNALRDQFRKQLTNVHALTVLTVSLFEIIGYLVLIRSGLEEFSWENRYLWICVVVPISVNVITHLIARNLVNRAGIRRDTKNAIIIAAALVTSFVVAVLHKEYIITSCAFVFPIILSAMFNDRKLLNASLVGALIIQLCVGIAFELDHSATLVTRLNLFVLFGFAVVSYFCGVISINFSRQNAVTIRTQAQNNDKLRDDVLRDQMTGLYNHSTFVHDLDRMVEHSARGTSLCLAMIDIDNFKKINDTFGHDCGDEVLICLAQKLRQHCAGIATPYRYGGEEFAVLLPDRSLHEACALLEALLEDLRGHRFPFSESPITFSAGVRAYGDGLDSSAFFELADQALYAAKRSGRNRIVS